MDHEEAQINFSDYLEGELSAQEQARLKEHLEGCPECQAELEDLRLTLSSLSGMRRVPPPPDFLGRVQQRIRRRSRGRFFTPERLLNRLPFEWISFIIIMIMLGVYMYSIQGQMKDVRPAPAPETPAKHLDPAPPSAAQPAGSQGSAPARGPTDSDEPNP